MTKAEIGVDLSDENCRKEAEIPDYDLGRKSGLMRRNPPSRGLGERRQLFYGPGGLPTEGIDPPPKPWPWVPWLALVICICFLALQLWPAAQFRQARNPSLVPLRDENKDGALKNKLNLGTVRRQWDPEIVETDANTTPPAASILHTSDLSTVLVEKEMSSESNGQYLKGAEGEQHIHVFLSSDDKDLRPLAVVINSTLQNARHPDRIVFHLVIPTSGSKIEYYKLKAFFPSASIEVFRGSLNFEKLSKLIQYRNDSYTREELTSPYNFLPYSLPHLYEDIELMIYLDCDVVVKGDIEELYMRNLKGHPAAAVEDCSQRFQSYFDFEQLNAIQEREPALPWLPEKPFDEETCIFNRGVLLINATRWTELNVTGTIEWWMEEFHKAEKPLYRYGISQPPFLLALYNNFEKLEHAWNNRGLGRDKLSKLEQDYLASRYKQRPNQKPFLSLESDSAKILHFNGRYKPWRRDRVRRPSEEVVALCGVYGQECYKLWWEYLSPDADHAFRVG